MGKTLPDDGAALDYLGRSVAISGETAVVEANRDDDNGTDSGSAYLFDINCDGPSLRIVGSCPGPMGFEASNVAPGEQVAFFTHSAEALSRSPQATHVPGLCLA